MGAGAKSLSAGGVIWVFFSGKSMISRKSRLRGMRRSFPERLSGWWLGEGIHRRSSPVLREIDGLVSSVRLLFMDSLRLSESSLPIPAITGNSNFRQSCSGAMGSSDTQTFIGRSTQTLNFYKTGRFGRRASGHRWRPVKGALSPLTEQRFLPKFFFKDLLPDNRNQWKWIYSGFSR